MSGRIRTPSFAAYEFGIETPLAPVSIRNGTLTTSFTVASTRISDPIRVNGISISRARSAAGAGAAGASEADPEYVWTRSGAARRRALARGRAVLRRHLIDALREMDPALGIGPAVDLAARRVGDRENHGGESERPQGEGHRDLPNLFLRIADARD